MYVPEHFNEKDSALIFEFLQENTFATLISLSKNSPVASHLPLLIEMKDEHLYLRGHVARANDQWLQLLDNPEVLVIFQGPHSYISPTYYQGSGVPTWNYVAVHASGSATITEDSREIKDIIEQLTKVYESSKAKPWTPDYPESMLKAIVGFCIKVERLEAKFKLSQNRSDSDRRGVINELSKLDDQNARAIASLMNKL